MSTSLPGPTDPDPTDPDRVETREERDPAGADRTPADAAPDGPTSSAPVDIATGDRTGMRGSTSTVNPSDAASDASTTQDGTPHEALGTPVVAMAQDATSRDTAAGAPTAKAAAKEHPAADDDADDDEPTRTAGQWWPYLAAVLAFLVAPYVIGVTLPAATATAVMLVLLPVAGFGLGLIDGAVFRATWSFPILTGLLCWFAMQLYSDPGTWIYAVGVFLLCLAGSHLGGRRRGGSEGRRADSDAAEV